MLETTAPIAVFRTGQGIVPHPKVGRAGAGAGGGGRRRRRGRSRTWGWAGWAGWPQQEVPWGGGGVGARDPRAYIYIYMYYIWEFPKIGVPYFGVLITRILLVRALY